MQLPLKITPCPITEAVIELRFDPSVDRDAVFGMMYEEISQIYSETPEKQSFIQFLPEEIRRSDPNFKYQPYYKFKRENFLLQLGPNVLAVSALPEYPGWEILKPEFLRLFTILSESNVVKKYTRLALRYINQLEGNATPNMRWQIMLGDYDVTKLPFDIRTVISEGQVDATLRYRNDAQGTNGERISIIDIDAVLKGPLDDFQDQIENYLDIIHLAEKQLFYSALLKEFIKTLNPIYAAI